MVRAQTDMTGCRVEARLIEARALEVPKAASTRA